MGYISLRHPVTPRHPLRKKRIAPLAMVGIFQQITKTAILLVLSVGVPCGSIAWIRTLALPVVTVIPKVTQRDSLLGLWAMHTTHCSQSRFPHLIHIPLVVTHIHVEVIHSHILLLSPNRSA